MGAAYCKSMAVEIGRKNKNNQYCGLSSIQVDSIRAAGGEVIDSREAPNFLGHVDVDIGLRVPANDEPPATPEAQQQLDERLDALLQKAAFHEDPAPDQDGWNGGEIVPSKAGEVAD